MKTLPWTKPLITAILAAAPLLMSGCANTASKAPAFGQPGSAGTYPLSGSAEGSSGRAIAPSSWSPNTAPYAMPASGRYSPPQQKPGSGSPAGAARSPG